MRISFQWRNRNKTQKFVGIVGSFVLVAVFGWYIASRVNANVPPPGAILCAVAPSLCPVNGQPPPPPPPVAQSIITKEVSAINNDGAKTSGSVKPGDAIKYKIRVKKPAVDGTVPTVVGWASLAAQLYSDGGYRSLPGNPPRDEILDMEAIDENTLYRSGKTIFIQKTIDGGNTWQSLLDEKKLARIPFAKGDGYMYGAHNFAKSMVIKFDVKKNDPNNLAAIVYIPELKAASIPSRYILALIATTDGGRNWKNIGLKDVNNVGVPKAKSYGEVGYSDDNKIWVSANVCVNRSNCRYDVYSSDLTHNFGTDWNNRTNNPGVSREPGHVDAYSTATFYGGEFISISPTEAYMTYMEQLNPNPNSTGITYSPHVIKIDNGAVLDITGDLNPVATDGSLVQPICRPIKLEKDANGTLYVITPGCARSLAKSSDGGKHWTAAQHEADLPERLFPPDDDPTRDRLITSKLVRFYDIDLGSNNVLYASVGASKKDYGSIVIKSTDSGDSWTIAHPPKSRYDSFMLIDMLILP